MSLFARRRRNSVVGATLISAALVLSGCTGDGATPTSAGKEFGGSIDTSITEAVTEALEQARATQALVAIWAPWSGDFVKAITTDGSTLEPNSQFRAAQSSQAVICAALLSLVNDGEFSLKRKVQNDVPRQVGIEGITYGQLCQATSGLADYKDGLQETFANVPERLWPERELIASGVVLSPLSAPGAQLHLSDTNAVLLGRALEVSLSRPLRDTLAEHVFERLELDDTYFAEPTRLTIDSPLSSTAYRMAGGALVCDVEQPASALEVSSSMLAGAGATVTTVTDMRDFYAEYLSGAFEWGGTKGLVTKTDNASDAPAENADQSVQWGFGLKHVAPLWGNSGAITGTASAAFHDPKSGYSVVVALNNSSAGANFAELLALKLTSLVADEAPGGLGELSWDAAQVEQSMKDSAVCQ